MVVRSLARSKRISNFQLESWNVGDDLVCFYTVGRSSLRDSLGTTNMGRFLQSDMRISDKVQLMTLEDHGGAEDNTSWLRSEGHRRRNSTWSFRVRPRRVRLTTSILGYFKRFWQLRTRRAPRRPARNLGLLAKLQFWRNQRARRIHSILDSSAPEEHSPLLLSNPESRHFR